MLKEGPVAIVDTFERLPDGILKDIQASYSELDLVNAAVDRFFLKVKKCLLQHYFSSSHQVFYPKMYTYP